MVYKLRDHNPKIGLESWGERKARKVREVKQRVQKMKRSRSKSKGKEVPKEKVLAAKKTRKLNQTNPGRNDLPRQNVSRELLWILTKNHNSHTFKRPGFNRLFSRDPLNPKGLHTLRNSSLHHNQHFSVEPLPTGKGVNLVYKRKRSTHKPSTNLIRVPLKKGFRKTVTNIKKFVNSTGYRRDLKTPVLRRACALLRAQKSVKGPSSSASTATKKE